MKKLFFLTCALILNAAPQKPSSLVLTAAKTSATLTWQDNSNDERGFKIYRDGKLIDFVKQNVTHYADTGLLPRTSYKYELKSSDDFAFKLEGKIEDVTHVALFIDADNNQNSGYSNNGIVGADILVQNREVYIRKTTDTNEWGDWEKVGDSQHQLNANSLFIMFDQQALGRVEISGDAKFQAYNYNANYSDKSILKVSTELLSVEGMTSQNFKAKLFIIGDSTVHNNELELRKNDGTYFEYGWGDMLGKYMINPNHVFNEARSGASSKSYKPTHDEKHDWLETKELIHRTDLKDGGYLFIQFGQNDSSDDGTLHTDAERGNSFYNHLKEYIDEAKDMGLIPVLITPVQMQFKGNHNIPSYVKTVRFLAEDENVLLLDLAQKSYDEFNKYISSKAIHQKFGYDDNIHFNPQGAKLVAGWVNELACSVDEKLCEVFKSDNKSRIYTFTQEGAFAEYEHFSFFIDADNNPNTGYKNGKVQGADFLVQDNGIIYQYPKNETVWKWDEMSDKSINFLHTDTTMKLEIPSSLLFDENSVRYNAFMATSDWEKSVALDTKNAILSSATMQQVYFTQTAQALKNPLKGFMIWPNDETSSREYVSLLKAIVPWREIEEKKGDGVDKIRRYSNDYMFNHDNYSVGDKNIKVNPIVTLWFNNDEYGKEIGDFFPIDMEVSDHDNQTNLFMDRIKTLVPKLAEAWDNDPRIGFVYMGITGRWGEQFTKIGVDKSLIMTPEVIKTLGDSFSKYFKNKKVLVRLPKYFNKTYLQSHDNKYRGNIYQNYYRFGMFWDAFAWEDEMNDGLLDTDEVWRNAKLWVDQPLLGEVAFNVDYQYIEDYAHYSDDLSWNEKNKKVIHETLVKSSSLDYLKDYIRSVHCTALSWISLYDDGDTGEAKAAKELQKTMGYRFVLNDASYTDKVNVGGSLKVSFSVKNIGSAPFYYDWPLEVALLDKDSKQVVWSDRFKHVDIQNWQPGDDWDFDNNRYKKVAKTYTINESFTLPQALKEGEYILAISILDPASMKPAVKFAVTNYYNGGRTPLGLVGVGVEPQGNLPAFDDLQNDGLTY